VALSIRVTLNTKPASQVLIKQKATVFLTLEDCLTLSKVIDV